MYNNVIVAPLGTTCFLFILYWSSVSTYSPLVLLKKGGSPFDSDFMFPYCARKSNNEIEYTPVNSKFTTYLACPAAQILVDNSPAFEEGKFCLIPSLVESLSCNSEVLPWFTKIGSCGPDSTSKLYRFGYRICSVHDGQLVKPTHLKIYDFCFSYEFQRHRTLYVDYKIMSPLLFNNEFFKNDDYQSDILHSGLVSEGNIPDDESMVDSFLVPPSHMVSTFWKKPLFYDVNIRGLDQNLVPIVNKLNENLKKLAIEELGEIHIKSGIFDKHVSEENVAIWWKLVYDESENSAIAIIIHNESSMEKICDDVCVQYGWQRLIAEDEKDLMYCCEPKFITGRMRFRNVGIFDLQKHHEVEYFKMASKCEETKFSDLKLEIPN